MCIHEYFDAERGKLAAKLNNDPLFNRPFEEVITMKILTTLEEGKLTLFFAGELDHHAARDAIRTISEKIDLLLPRECVIDFSDLNFMDSSGIAVVLKTHRKMEGLGGRAWVENVGKQPLKVLDASGLNKIIKIHAMNIK